MLYLLQITVMMYRTVVRVRQCVEGSKECWRWEGVVSQAMGDEASQMPLSTFPCCLLYYTMLLYHLPDSNCHWFMFIKWEMHVAPCLVNVWVVDWCIRFVRQGTARPLTLCWRGMLDVEKSKKRNGLYSKLREIQALNDTAWDSVIT